MEMSDQRYLSWLRTYLRSEPNRPCAPDTSCCCRTLYSSLGPVCEDRSNKMRQSEHKIRPPMSGLIEHIFLQTGDTVIF
jgi:hypothetical protein